MDNIFRTKMLSRINLRQVRLLNLKNQSFQTSSYNSNTHIYMALSPTCSIHISLQSCFQKKHEQITWTGGSGGCWLFRCCRKVAFALSHCSLNLYDLFTWLIHSLHTWAGRPSPAKTCIHIILELPLGLLRQADTLSPRHGAYSAWLAVNILKSKC